MRYAQNATTSSRVVRTVAELQMALADKARGQRIAQLRKRKRLTQQAMAERLQIAYRTYQTWEAGTMPEWANLEKLADVLEVKPEHLIGESEPAPTSQLDRIEAKLDDLLSRLAEDRMVATLEAEVARLREQAKKSAAKSPRKTPSRRAA